MAKNPLNAAASTPAGRGANNAGNHGSSTSLAVDSLEAVVVAPPKPDDSPVEAGADEIWRISAVDRNPRLILSASSDGCLTLVRSGTQAFRLNAREVGELHDFLESTATIRGQA